MEITSWLITSNTCKRMYFANEYKGPVTKLMHYAYKNQ